VIDVINKAIRAQYPFGLPQNELIDLGTVHDRGQDATFAALFAKATKARAEIIEMGWADEPNSLQRVSYHLPMNFYAGDLTPAEICLMQTHQDCSGTFSKDYESTPAFFIVRKLSHSDWHWGIGDYKNFDWAQHQRYARLFRAFDFGLPGFDVYLDACGVYSEHGPSEFTETWIDSGMAINIVHKGQHALTIGVSPTQNGLLVHQVQLKQKRGNRWLFKLGCSLLEWVLLRLYAACAPEGVSLWLVDGASGAEWVMKSYKTKEREAWRREHEARVTALYDAPLTHFTRRQGADHVRKNIIFRELIPVKES
jgi:hypothetical protein